MYFDNGIDDFGSWLDVLKAHKLVKQSGAWYTLVKEDTKEEIRFQSKDFEKKVAEVEGLKDYLYAKICEACILTYNSKELGIDDVETTDEAVDEL